MFGELKARDSNVGQLRRGQAFSMLAHVFALLTLFGNASWLVKKTEPARSSRPSRSVKLLIPQRQSPQRVQMHVADRPSLRPTPPVIFSLPQPELKVDLSAIQISFADDLTNQLPDVVRNYNGMLAFVDRNEPVYARYVAEPPGWKLRETVMDISGRTRFSMTPAEKWSLIESIAREHPSLSLAQYDVCALFQSTYAGCLRDAIRKKAMADTHAGGLPLQSARLGFASRGSCGVEVLALSFGEPPGNP